MHRGPRQVKLIGSPGLTPVRCPDGTDSGVREARGCHVGSPWSVGDRTGVRTRRRSRAPAAVAVITEIPAAPMNPPTRASAPTADPVFSCLTRWISFFECATSELGSPKGRKPRGPPHSRRQVVTSTFRHAGAWNSHQCVSHSELPVGNVQLPTPFRRMRSPERGIP